MIKKTKRPKLGKSPSSPSPTDISGKPGKSLPPSTEISSQLTKDDANQKYIQAINEFQHKKYTYFKKNFYQGVYSVEDHNGNSFNFRLFKDQDLGFQEDMFDDETSEEDKSSEEEEKKEKKDDDCQSDDELIDDLNEVCLETLHQTIDKLVELSNQQKRMLRAAKNWRSNSPSHKNGKSQDAQKKGKKKGKSIDVRGK